MPRWEWNTQVDTLMLILGKREMASLDKASFREETPVAERLFEMIIFQVWENMYFLVPLTDNGH